jgi:hypothetical protein
MGMTKDQFIEVLKQGASTQESKIECIQFFIDNYPVLAKVSPFSNAKQWTSIKDVKVTGGAPQLVDYAFAKLQQRVVELQNFK